MSKFRSASPTRDPTLVPQPQRIDPTGYTEFNDWLTKANSDQIDKYYSQFLKPEYDELGLGLRDTYGNIQNYTRIMDSIQTPGFLARIYRSTPDLEQVRSSILGMIDEINMARTMNMQRKREGYAQSAQSEKMITVPEAEYYRIVQERNDCQQREIDREKQLRASGTLDRRIQDAQGEYTRLGFEAARSVTGEGRNYDVISDEMRVQRERLNRLLKQQQEQQQRGGKSKRSKRVKRSKRSKRVKRSKRSSTKRH